MKYYPPFMMKCCAFSNIVIFVSDRNAQKAVWLDSRSPGAGQLDLSTGGSFCLSGTATLCQRVCSVYAISTRRSLKISYVYAITQKFYSYLVCT
jgi:hypothetical protein